MTFFLSIQGVAKTILYILIIYFVVKIISRLLTPFLVRYAAKKMEQRFGNQFNNEQQHQTRQKEGETVVDKIPQQQKSSNKDVGEYVDFEEID